MFSGTIAENMRNVKQDATDEEIIEALKLACAWDFVEKLPDGIESIVKERGGGFSEGQAQRLSIARALLRRSPILLLDEPSMGLAPILVEQIFEIILKLNQTGTTILLVEQNAQMALQVADRAYVLETGRITLSGTGKELMASDAVRKAYLGG